jgi:nucleoside-diphosphate-sugar epimerase
MSQKKILVLGAGGLIGSKLFEKINTITNLQVIGFSHKKNIKPNIFQCNYVNFNKKIRKIIKDADIIINCIGENSNKDLMYYKNKLILEKLLRIVNNTKKKKIFIHISTCAVYGPMEIKKIAENTQPKPASLYSISKLEGENFIKQNVNKKINLIILRSSQVIGVGLNNTPLKKLNFVIKKKLYFYMQNQSAVFSYIFIEDLIGIIIKLFEKKNIFYSVYNVSNYISFKQLVNINKKYLNIKTKFFSINSKIAKILFFFLTILTKIINVFLKRRLLLNLSTFNSLTTKKIYVSKKILKYLNIRKFITINKKNYKFLIK